MICLDDRTVMFELKITIKIYQLRHGICIRYIKGKGSCKGKDEGNGVPTAVRRIYGGLRRKIENNMLKSRD